MNISPFLKNNSIELQARYHATYPSFCWCCRHKKHFNEKISTIKFQIYIHTYTQKEGEWGRDPKYFNESSHLFLTFSIGWIVCACDSTHSSPRLFLVHGAHQYSELTGKILWWKLYRFFTAQKIFLLLGADWIWMKKKLLELF